MVNDDYQGFWWVWWIWWICFGRYLCLSEKLSATWRIQTPDIPHPTSHVLTVTGSEAKLIHQIHQTHQTEWQWFVAGVTVWKIIRKIVTAARRFLLGGFVCGGAQRISPPASGGGID